MRKSTGHGTIKGVPFVKNLIFPDRRVCVCFFFFFEGVACSAGGDGGDVSDQR